MTAGIVDSSELDQRRAGRTLALAALQSSMEDRQPPAGGSALTDRESQSASEACRRTLQNVGLDAFAQQMAFFGRSTRTQKRRSLIRRSAML